jgi:AraC-like DNA-binding protein
MATNITRDDLRDPANWAEISRESHYNVKQLAKDLGYGARQVERFMLSEFGVKPKAWLDNQQMERMQELLRHSQRSLKEISEEAGFKRFEHFCSKFKRRIGLSPGAWRNSNGSLGMRSR